MNNGDFYPTDPDNDPHPNTLDLIFASVFIVLIILVILISGLFYFTAPHTPEVLVPAGDCLNHICM